MAETLVYRGIRRMYRGLRDSSPLREVRGSQAYGWFRRTRLYQRVLHARRLLFWKDYREKDRKARADFERFCRDAGGSGLRAFPYPKRSTRTALIVRNVPLLYAPIEALLMKALHTAGLRTRVIGRRDFDILRFDWLVGNQTGYDWSDFDNAGDPAWVDRQMPRLDHLAAWLSLEYQGARVGRYVVASVMRNLRAGRLDFHDPGVRGILREYLARSVRNATAAARVLDRLRPDCAFLIDRGYSGQGEIADLLIGRGIDTIVWKWGHKSNLLDFKRYNSRNFRDHPMCPSDTTWEQLRSMTWTREHGERIRNELRQLYESQDWFSSVGTQFGKRMLAAGALREKLGLRADRKVAVVFPHILWDGSFFYGEDLFEDYSRWLVETIRAACDNPRVNWVVKLHPAHVVKASQYATLANVSLDSVTDAVRPAEVEVIEREIGKLPPHITLVHPHTDISTWSLFELADYVVTVRGTVGIEAALFGIPVITAGTGRYDRRGFTVDSATREEYLEKLGKLEEVPAMTPAQVALAERYAYGVFLMRPLPLVSASLAFERDEVATPRLAIRCRTREEWAAAPDLQRLGSWLTGSKAEDLIGSPEPG